MGTAWKVAVSDVMVTMVLKAQARECELWKIVNCSSCPSAGTIACLDSKKS